MGDTVRVLVSCPLAWDGLDEFAEIFEQRQIVIDLPELTAQALSEDDLLPIIDNYAGVLAGDDQLSRPVIQAASRLKVISKWGVGVDAIDIDAAGERGIVVFNTPGMFGEELADYALGYILLLARKQNVVDREVKAGNWHKPRGRSLAGLTMGIVGLGSSGSALAERAMAMKMDVLGADPFVSTGEIPTGVTLVGLDELLQSADILSLHVPLTAETESLIDAAAIARMRPGAWLINTSRGALVDENALLVGLGSGQVGAAALDVFRQEPVAPGNPLLVHPNVIVGSHNGSNTAEAVRRTTRLSIENLLAGLSGETVT
jgi:D-3-phosphoglycerate dehydrogenase